MEQPYPTPKRRYEMPFLLLCGMGLSALFAATMALVFAIFAVVGLSGGGSYSIDDQPVTREEFFSSIWPLYLIMPAAIALMGAIAWFLWREDPRSRPLMLGYWGVMLCVEIGLGIGMGTADAWGGAVMTALFVLVAWGYLYHKGNVVAYYRLLERQRAPAAAPTPTLGDEGGAPV